MKYTLLTLAISLIAFPLTSCDSDDEDANPDTSTPETAEGKAAQAVDLGLSVRWAAWNVGASAAGEVGYYLAWGETKPKSEYSWASYTLMADGGSGWEHINKYQTSDGQTSADWFNSAGTFIGDGLATLQSSDDAASVNWGGVWRMPTQAEMQELAEKCTWEWKDEDECGNGVPAGYVITGTNGNTIFLPAAGYMADAQTFTFGQSGYYWSSNLYTGNTGMACALTFAPDYTDQANHTRRHIGMTVRPVRPVE